jgi:hypothetical protein
MLITLTRELSFRLVHPLLQDIGPKRKLFRSGSFRLNRREITFVLLICTGSVLSLNLKSTTPTTTQTLSIPLESPPTLPVTATQLRPSFPRMDSLPTEVLGLILLWNVRMCRCEKNALLPLRLVCKAFDDALKPYVFKAVQLEFSKFHRHEPTPDISSLARVGNTCEALYLDMMVVRDEGTLVIHSTAAGYRLAVVCVSIFGACLVAIGSPWISQLSTSVNRL